MAAVIKVRAERKAGEILSEMKDKGERKASSKSRSKTTLKDLSITKDKSSQWQCLAAVPEEVFEEHISEQKKC